MFLELIYIITLQENPKSPISLKVANLKGK